MNKTFTYLFLKAPLAILLIGGSLNATGQTASTDPAVLAYGMSETALSAVTPGGPKNITLARETLFENRAAGTLAGTLSSTSNDPLAVYTYTLVPGPGDCSNDMFVIEGNKIKTLKPLDYEERKAYCVRVRSTMPNGGSSEKSFSIELSDVNEPPTLDAIANANQCYSTELQTLTLTGISAGPEKKQAVQLTATSTNEDLFEQLSVDQNGKLTYQVKAGKSGVAEVTVTVTDNGGTENGGEDSFSRSFSLTVSSLPEVAIRTDKGISISKGETIQLTASGGSTYSWINPGDVISGSETETLVARPAETTTYTVRVTGSSGCTAEKEITIFVKDDYAMLRPTNVITPNGDGKNDRFVVTNIEMYTDHEVRIFDSAGRMLYNTKNYRNEWDGTFQGTTLDEGNYFYVVDFGKDKPTLKGYITIIRD